MRNGSVIQTGTVQPLSSITKIKVIFNNKKCRYNNWKANDNGLVRVFNLNNFKPKNGLFLIFIAEKYLVFHLEHRKILKEAV